MFQKMRTSTSIFEKYEILAMHVYLGQSCEKRDITNLLTLTFEDIFMYVTLAS
jgi:hypothetical protein